jgi:hypothetical protein
MQPNFAETRNRFSVSQWGQARTSIHHTAAGSNVERETSRLTTSSIEHAHLGCHCPSSLIIRRAGIPGGDVLKADLISLLQKRGESELKLFAGIVSAFDEWKSGV